MPCKKTIVISLLGSILDRGSGPQRWENWRPNVALFQHENFLVHRYELLYEPKFNELADQILDDIGRISPETELRRHCQTLSDPWEFEEVYETFDNFARSYPFDPDKEDYLLSITTGSHVEQICLFLLAESRRIPARLLQITPPTRSSHRGLLRVIDLNLSRYDKLAARFERDRSQRTSFLKAGIVTRNEAFNTLIDRIEQVAIRSKAPFLLMGPTGAGKSQLARRIYELKRSNFQLEGVFVEMNCATLRGEAVISALFGHVRGSFTGALRDRVGLLKSADGGMLFLDEVGELGLDEQAMLLRALEEHRFFPLGADKEISSNFQLIAGTNQDLAIAVRDGHFREDLLARINLWTFRLPGLRDRRQDIEPNIQHELEKLELSESRHVTFNREAKALYLDFASSPDAIWSANFRDLNASITRMVTLAEGGRITRPDVEEEIRRLRESWGTCVRSDSSLLEPFLLPDALDQLDRFDRVQLEDVVRVCRETNSLSDAGRLLFSSSRLKRQQVNDADRLRKYLSKFGLDWQTLKSVGEQKRQPTAKD